jgi:hypothetical protein
MLWEEVCSLLFHFTLLHESVHYFLRSASLRSELLYLIEELTFLTKNLQLLTTEITSQN